jgi:hypothetical protein
MASASDNSANGAPGLHRGAVDRRAPVGSSSTRPSPTSGTHHDVELDELAFDAILGQLADDAARYLYEAGFDSHRVRLAMAVEYEP